MCLTFGLSDPTLRRDRSGVGASVPGLWCSLEGSDTEGVRRRPRWISEVTPTTLGVVTPGSFQGEIHGKDKRRRR